MNFVGGKKYDKSYIEEIVESKPFKCYIQVDVSGFYSLLYSLFS